MKTLINNEVVVNHNHEATISRNINNVNKYKITKESFMYYEKNYNDASSFQLFILKILNDINMIGKKISFENSFSSLTVPSSNVILVVSGRLSTTKFIFESSIEIIQNFYKH